MNNNRTPIELENEVREAYGVALSILLNTGDGSVSGKAFFAHFLNRMNVTFDSKKVPTAGVSITDKINLCINPEFFLSLGLYERMDLLQHEVEHIVYLHPLRAKEIIGEVSHANIDKFRLYNIAADANINEKLTHITKKRDADGKEMGVTIARLNKMLEEKGVKDRLSYENPAETHYATLYEHAEKIPQGGGQGEIDDHGMWGESSNNEELVKAVVKDVADKAVKATGIGNVPNHINQQIGVLGKSLVNWKSQLRQFFANAQKYDRTKTRSRRNRRYGILQAGVKKNPKLKIAVCVDSSGSVSDESFTKFFNEINEISKNNVEILVLDADCEVQAVYDYKRGQKVERRGQGGTAYAPAINKAKELKVDGILYCGDFDSSDTPIDPKLPFLWVGVGSQKPPADFGRVIYIND